MKVLPTPPKSKMFAPETDEQPPPGVRYVRVYLVDNETLETPVFTALTRRDDSQEVECAFLEPLRSSGACTETLMAARAAFDHRELVVFLVPSRIEAEVRTRELPASTLVVGVESAMADPEVYPQIAVLVREAKNANKAIVSLFDTRSKRSAREAFCGPIEAYTDGSYYKRDAVGSAAVVTSDGAYCVESGSHIGSSSEAEATALALALSHLPWDLPLTLYSDSSHVVEALSGPRRPGDAAKAPKGMREAIRALEKRQAPTEIKWVKGHSTSTMNNVADRLARSASRCAIYGTDEAAADRIFSSIVASSGSRPSGLLRRAKATRDLTQDRRVRHSLLSTDNPSHHDEEDY